MKLIEKGLKAGPGGGIVSKKLVKLLGITELTDSGKLIRFLNATSKTEYDSLYLEIRIGNITARALVDSGV
jgi:hypothetical protein